MKQRKTFKPTELLCRFYIVRHGESESNVTRNLAGHTDVKLTTNGKKQAKKRANDLRHISFSAVFSSDLLRAKETAEILALEHQIAIETQEVLRERFFGAFEGMNYDEYNVMADNLREKIKHLTQEQQLAMRLGGEVESNDELFSRMQVFLRETALAYPGKNVMIVCHGGIMREFLIRVGVGGRTQLLPGAVKNLGYVVVDSDGVDFFVRKIDGVILSL